MKKILKSFFCSNNGKTNFKPPYFWATVILALFVTTGIFQLLNPAKSYNGLLGILGGMTTALIGLYNIGKKTNGK